LPIAAVQRTAYYRPRY